MTQRMTQQGYGRREGGRLSTNWRRPARWFAPCVLVVLAGCALTFAYRHADWLILWQLDHYFDLTADQRREVTQRLKPLLSRHRHEAIPQYQAVLTDLQQRVGRGLTSVDIDWVYATYDRLRDDLFDRVATDGALFLATVDDRQAHTLERAFGKDNRKAARLVEAPASERLGQRAEATLEGLEDWVGSLSTEQRAQIRAWSLALPDAQPVWVAYQRQRQQELLELLRQPRTPNAVAQKLRDMFVHPEHSAPTEYREAVRRMRAAVKDMALAIDQGLTHEQRRHAVDRLQRLIDQIHALHVE